MTKKYVLGTLFGGEIEIVTYSPEFETGVNELVTDSYCQSEVCCNAFGFNDTDADDARKEMQTSCHDDIKDGISLLAIDVERNKVVGFAINKIHVKEAPDDKSHSFMNENWKSDSMRGFMTYVDSVGEKFNIFAHIDRDCCVETTFLGTHHEYGKRGIGRSLLSHTIELAQRLKGGQCLDLLTEELRSCGKRPGFVLAIFTSIYSQKIGEQLGYVTHYRAPYAEYEYKGKSLAELIQNRLHSSANFAARLLK